MAEIYELSKGGMDSGVSRCIIKNWSENEDEVMPLKAVCTELNSVFAQLTEAKTEIVEQNEINTKQGHACVNYLKKIVTLNKRIEELEGKIETVKKVMNQKNDMFRDGWDELKAENARYRKETRTLKLQIGGLQTFILELAERGKVEGFYVGEYTALNGEGDNDGPQ